MAFLKRKSMLEMGKTVRIANLIYMLHLLQKTVYQSHEDVWSYLVLPGSYSQYVSGHRGSVTHI